jgi:YD repeat-containing protein
LAHAHTDRNHPPRILSTVAAAQTTFYDSRGRLTGTTSARGNVTTFRNRMGREIGTAERRPDGRTQYRDVIGREIGTATAPRR